MSQDVSVRVTGTSCTSWVGRVERVLRATEGVTGASVYLATETVRREVEHAASLPEAVAAIPAAGGPVIVRTAKHSVEGMPCASWTASCGAGLVRI